MGGLMKIPELDTVQDKLSKSFAHGLMLWPKERADLIGFGGERAKACGRAA